MNILLALLLVYVIGFYIKLAIAYLEARKDFWFGCMIGNATLMAILMVKLLLF